MKKVKPINKNKVKVSLLLGVDNSSITEDINFLYEIISTLEEKDKLNDLFTKRDIKKVNKLSYCNDLKDSLLWLSKNSDYIELSDKRTGGTDNFYIKHHPWE